MEPRTVQFSSRCLVVAKVGEPPRLAVQPVRPVGVGATGVENGELGSPLPRASAAAKAPLVPNRKESAEGIVPCVPRAAALVRGVDDEVSTVEFGE